MAAAATNIDKSMLSNSRPLKMENPGTHTMLENGTKLDKYGTMMFNSKENSKSSHQ